jgi:succinate dehydrogenase/fumarate reductase cytochrome b subunit
MIIKYMIVAVLMAIVFSLGSGLYYLLTDKGGSKRLLNSLTVRIALSVVLFILLFIGWYFGLLQPHPVAPVVTP